MLLSSARDAAVPPCLPLGAAPLWPLPLAEPPRAAWIGAGRHGRWAREDYRLSGLWCVHLYRWSGALRVALPGGAGVATLPVRPGYASLVPPDTPLSHFFAPGARPCLHVSSGFALPAVGEGEGTVPTFAPMMQDLGDDFGRLNRLFEEAVGRFATQPRRAEARLWEILWQLAERGGGEAPAAPGEEHGAVARAREIIELRLGEPELRVADVAAAVGLSHNHLTRLFHAATGRTVVGYLRERRVARARRLLLHTDLPVKQVAAQVGMPDLHRFNKAVRTAEDGLSPRALRRRAGEPPVGYNG